MGIAINQPQTFELQKASVLSYLLLSFGFSLFFLINGNSHIRANHSAKAAGGAGFFGRHHHLAGSRFTRIRTQSQLSFRAGINTKPTALATDRIYYNLSRR